MEAPLAQLPHSHLRLADLATRKATRFALTPTSDERKAIADALGIIAVKKLRFEGELTPLGRTDWRLTAQLGATAVQECVITLAPVTTRVDEDVMRTYSADFDEIESSEVEMPEDDTFEPLPSTIDVAEVMIEALSLALPAYPRSEGAALGQVVYTQPGAAPMTDDDAKPFAGLSALREAIEKKEE